MTRRVVLTVLASVCLLAGAGCGSQTPEEAVRKRWEQFMACVFSNDIEAGLQIMDPAYVSREGVEVVKGRLKNFSDLFRVGRISEADLRIDKVVVSADGKTAVVEHSMRTRDGKWLSQVPYGSWVKIDKNWYINLAVKEP